MERGERRVGVGYTYQFAAGQVCDGNCCIVAAANDQRVVDASCDARYGRRVSSAKKWERERERGKMKAD